MPEITPQREFIADVCRWLSVQENVDRLSVVGKRLIEIGLGDGYTALAMRYLFREIYRCPVGLARRARA